MKDLVLLSHVYDVTTPGYGGSVVFQRSPGSAISQSKSSNSETWTLKNHSGTHIDYPHHFFDGAASYSSYTPQDHLMVHSFLYDLTLIENQIIMPTDLEKVPADLVIDFLIIRTGFEKLRDEEAYWKSNPGFHPNCAHFLRQQFPNLRAIGFDFISLTAFQHRELGREAHRQFLNPKKPIWIVEDMKLSPLKTSKFSCLISPFPVKDADGAPANIFAFNFPP